jgi:hypothetical protein
VSGEVLEIDAVDVRAAAGPEVPADALSGLALSQAISSLRSFAGNAFFEMIRSELLGSSATGSRSFNRSYGSAKIAPFTTCVPTWPMPSV